MQNKKLIILVILIIGAIASLIYGINAPPKTKYGVQRAPSSVEERIEMAKRTISVKRRARKTEYTVWGRNPFVPELTPKERLVKLTLNGILWDEDYPSAILNKSIVKIGDVVDGNTIVDIGPDKVILNDGTGDFELRLE
ncbi:MAG: hypothetical protein ISS34_00725 [Candidatus Omnitrophica bacterium]|nr:hypothetical protein [Candidatus Omnitrophota bacterium]